jgi:hypothetical protein
MVWLEAIYQPTTLFSLRPSWTTSSGGKSLLLPTPYAAKMALLDVAIQTSGLPAAKKSWPWIRDLSLGIRLPTHIVVTNLFAKILKIRRRPAEPGSPDEGPFQKSIGYREYVYHSDAIQLVWGVPEKQAAQLHDWLLQINYLGKRGGFVQIMALPQPVEDLSGYTILTDDVKAFPKEGMVQQLDDCDPKMSFTQANIYTGSRPKRIMRHIVLPYRLAQSSRSYSLYEYAGLSN